MKKIIIAIILMFGSTAIFAQNFKARQQKQENIIKAACKSKRVSELECEKLMGEQLTIKNTMTKYEADGVLDAHEKNVINDKLLRAEKRLKRYRTNGEVY